MQTHPTPCPHVRLLTRGRRRLFLAYLRILRLFQGPIIRVRMPPFVRAVLRVMAGAVAVMGATPHENHNLVALFVALEFGVFMAYVLRNWGTRYSGPERRHSYAVRHAHYV